MYDPIYYLDERFALITDAMVPGVDLYRYMVSNYGKVIDLHRQSMVSIWMNDNGYLKVTLHTNIGSNSKSRVHRLVAMAFIPGDWSLQVNHIDGNKLNNYVGNLEWVTARDNIIHAVDNDLNYRGQDKPNAIISNSQARIICLGLQERLRIPEILQNAGLEDNDSTRGIVIDIKRGKSFTFISKYFDIDDAILRDRSLTNDQIRTMCQYLEQEPSLTPVELMEMIGCGNLTGGARTSMRNKISNLKARKSYTDISKNYKW